jgi:hypothetical protein
MFGATFMFFLQVPYYNKPVNIIWGGLWIGILDVTVILLVSEVTSYAHQDDHAAYTSFLTNVSLAYCLLWPAILQH